MFAFFIALALLHFASADFLRLDRWPVLKDQAMSDAKSMFDALRNSKFPNYSNSSVTNETSGTLQIWNFRLTEVVPRLMFMSPKFYPSPDQDTYTINLPLGYHMTAEFEWIYNFGILPVSGMGSFDTDVHSLSYNVTLGSHPPDITVTIHVNYTTVPITEVYVPSSFGSTYVSKLLTKVVPVYLELVKKTTEEVFTKTLSERYNNIFPKKMPIQLYYPSFQYAFNLISNISAVTTRDSLVLAYGADVIIPANVPASDKVSRQYCVEEELLDTIVEEVWPHMNAVFRLINLPIDSTVPITVGGLAMLVPDAANDFDRNSEVKVSITATNEKQNIQLAKINETHGKATGFKIDIGFHVENSQPFAMTLSCDLIVVPNAFKLGDAFVMNVRPIVAQIVYDSFRFHTKYETIVTNHVKAMATEYINGLLLPYLGYALLGNGLTIRDNVTPYSHAEYAIAQNAVCLNLAVTV